MIKKSVIKILGMSSLIEKMSTLKRIVIEPDQQIVIEVKKNGLTMSEFVVGLHGLDYQASTGKSNIKVHAINPNGFGEQHTEIVTTTYSND